MLDYLLVGSGLFSCCFAFLAKKYNKTCLIIEKRSHPFGNCYTQDIDGINVHKYGPHIFHTSSDKIWNFVNQFSKFNNYINRPKVNYNNIIYSFPINLFTLYQLWDVKTPQEAYNKLQSVKINIDKPSNLEEWILTQVGEEIYNTFIYGYTKKQWNTDPKNLPASIIKRLPIRLNFDDNYFNDTFQGIPIGGYSSMLSNMIDGTEIVLDTDYLSNREYWNSQAKTVIYCGQIDKFFNNEFGSLDYRSLNFENIKLDIQDFQGNAIVNYTSFDVPYTRIVEHKHFESVSSPTTIITKEYPKNYDINSEPYYPINNIINNELYEKYKILSKQQNNIFFGGRLAQYKYFDMHQVIGSSIQKFMEINNVSTENQNIF